MRKALTQAAIWEWWLAATSGLKPPVHLDDPHAGFFKRRLVRGGPWVAARIWLEQDLDEETGELLSDPVWRCLVNGKPMDANDQWTWLCGHPITEKEFRLMTGTKDSPEARKREVEALAKIDWSVLPPPMFERKKA